MSSTLSGIIAVTRERLAHARRTADARQLEQRAAARQTRGFRRALEQKNQAGVAVIAELKKASPSRGAIRPDLCIGEVAADFERAGAAALSVLTEQQFFCGSPADLTEASAATRLPCLRKDFFVDELQVLEAKAIGADAVLLILSALDDSEFSCLLQRSRELGLDALCEVHDQSELERALALGAEIIGVNNRDLHTFKVDLGTAVRLAPSIPSGVLRVAESGIHNGDDIRRLRDVGYQAFLIGESLMRAASPGAELANMLASAGRET